MHKENHKILTKPVLNGYTMFQIIMMLIVMPRKVSHKEGTKQSFYEGSDKYKIAGSLTTL